MEREEEAAYRAALEGAYADRRPQGNVESVLDEELADDVSDRRHEIEIVDLDYEDYH